MLRTPSFSSSARHQGKNGSKVALVCDWLTVIGGAEQVLREIHQLFPKAPIYTSQYRPKNIDWFKNSTVITGWLNFLPAFTRRFIAPLRQNYFKHLDLTSYDLVISVSGCDAKFVKTRPGTHVCYCHVPTQYYWGKVKDYLRDPGFGVLNPLIRPAYRLLLPRLRKKDLEAASRPDFYITISEFAKAEIKKYYKREAEVIFPPVNTRLFSEVKTYKNIEQGNCQIIEKHKKDKSQIDSKKHQNIKISKSQTYPEIPLAEQNKNHIIKNRKNQIELTSIIASYNINYEIKPHQNQQDKELCQNIKSQNGQSENVENFVKLSSYFINFSRQVSWKRLDLAIKACIRTEEPLVLIGDGPEHQNLAGLAKKHPDLIFLIKTLPQTALKEYLKHARAFLFPSEEPFGIAPVEALAAGCPVIAYNKGGAKDYIVNEKNGLFFDSQTVSSLVSAIQRFNQLAKNSADRQEKGQKHGQKTSSQKMILHNSPSSFLSPPEISQTAEKFSKEQFRLELERFINQVQRK